MRALFDNTRAPNDTPSGMSAATRTMDLAPQPLAARELFRRVYCTSDGDPHYWLIDLRHNKDFR